MLSGTLSVAAAFFRRAVRSQRLIPPTVSVTAANAICRPSGWIDGLPLPGSYASTTASAINRPAGSRVPNTSNPTFPSPAVQWMTRLSPAPNPSTAGVPLAAVSSTSLVFTSCPAANDHIFALTDGQATTCASHSPLGDSAYPPLFSRRIVACAFRWGGFSAHRSIWSESPTARTVATTGAPPWPACPH